MCTAFEQSPLGLAAPSMSILITPPRDGYSVGRAVPEAVRHTPLIPALRQMDLSEFEASLVYEASSRTAT